MNSIKNRPYLLIIFFSSLIVVWIFWEFVVDDAYISYVYSRNLVSGNGLTYNGLLVEGYSNLLWTLTISPWLLMGFDPLIASRLISILSLALIIVLLDDLIRFYYSGIGKLHSAMALSTFSVCSTIAAWTVGGLETIFFSLLVVLFLYIEVMEVKRAVILSPIVVLLLALTRPEGAMFIVVMITYRLSHQRKVSRELIRSVLSFLLPFGLFLLWRYITYGYLLPNTAYVKLDTSLSSVAQALEWLAYFFFLRPIYALVFIASIFILIRERELFDRRWVLLFLIVGALIVFILYAGRDWMPFHRFLAPLVPLFSLIIARLIYHFRTGLMSVGILSIVVAIGVYEIVISATVFQNQIHDFGMFTQGLLDAGQMIERQTQEDAVIAIEDAGALAYASSRKSVDILGLNNPFIAHHPDLDIAAYVLSFEPKFVQLHLEQLPSGDFTGSKDSQASGLIFQDPAFTSCYRQLTLWEDEPYIPYLFIRECN